MDQVSGLDSNDSPYVTESQTPTIPVSPTHSWSSGCSSASTLLGSTHMDPGLPNGIAEDQIPLLMDLEDPISEVNTGPFIYAATSLLAHPPHDQTSSYFRAARPPTASGPAGRCQGRDAHLYEYMYGFLGLPFWDILWLHLSQISSDIFSHPHPQILCPAQ